MHAAEGDIEEQSLFKIFEVSSKKKKIQKEFKRIANMYFKIVVFVNHLYFLNFHFSYII